MKGLITLVFLPFFFFIGALYVVGIVFSIIMLVDCLKREHTDFKTTFTKNREYDKIMWTIFIIVGVFLYHLGAILYFFLVKKSLKQNAGNLKTICIKCENEVKDDWKVCPYCGERKK